MERRRYRGRYAGESHAEPVQLFRGTEPDPGRTVGAVADPPQSHIGRRHRILRKDHRGRNPAPQIGDLSRRGRARPILLRAPLRTWPGGLRPQFLPEFAIAADLW